MKKHVKRNKRSNMILVIVGVVLGVIFILLMATFIWNWTVESQPPNKAFLGGKLPSPALNGPYKGTWGNTTSWKGKEFDATQNTGLNLIDGTKKYPFETSTAKSLHSDQEVLKLNYNLNSNPWWLRFIVDEVVQVAPGKYQGKVYVRIPGLALTITYFQLKK